MDPGPAAGAGRGALRPLMTRHVLDIRMAVRSSFGEATMPGIARKAG